MTNRSDDFRGMFPQELRAEITQLHQELSDEEKRSSSGVIENKQLKKKLAQSCLKALEDAEKRMLPLKAVYALLGSFPFYEYEDSLNEAFALLHELDFGFDNLRENTAEKQIDRIKQIINNYGKDDLL